MELLDKLKAQKELLKSMPEDLPELIRCISMLPKMVKNLQSLEKEISKLSKVVEKKVLPGLANLKKGG